MTTMVSSEYYENLLDGNETEILHMSSDLPCQGEVLRYLNYMHKVKEKPIRVSAKMAVRRCLQIWGKIGIPTSDELEVVARLEGLYKEYLYHLKCPNIDNQMWFTVRMSLLFDISARNALDLIQDDWVKNFFCHKLDKDLLTRRCLPYA